MTTSVNFSYPCYFHSDGSKKVDQDHWGVTFIADKATGLSNHHARILIEMVNESGEYKKILVDLVGGGSSRIETGNRVEGSWCASFFGKIAVVRIRDKPEISQHGKPITESGHSETWIRSAHKVQAMLAQVKKEKENDLAHPRAFSIFGKHSKLAPEIKVYGICDPALEPAYKRNPKLLINIFKKYNQFKEATGFTRPNLHPYFWLSYQVHHDSFTKLQKDNQDNEGHKKFLIYSIPMYIFIVSAIPFYFHEQQRKAYYRELDLYMDMKKLALKGINTFSDVLEIDDIVEAHDDESLKEEDRMVDHFLLQVSHGIKEKTSMRDNCCTWALEKLAMVDIDMPSMGQEWFITDTRNYLT